MMSLHEQAEINLITIAQSIESGALNNPRGVYLTAAVIYVARCSLLGRDPDWMNQFYLYPNYPYMTEEITFYTFPGATSYQSIHFNYDDLLPYAGECWEARRYSPYYYETWCKFHEDPDLHRIDQNLKPEDFLSINRLLLLAHTVTPTEPEVFG